jgi:hypothetical protein
MIESIFASLGGGLLRMLPEGLKFLDRKAERKHELALQQTQLDLTKLQQAGQLQLSTVQTNAVQFAASMDAVKDALSGQFKSSGVKWIDGLTSSVRPVVTYIVVAMWIAAKAAAYSQLLEAGISWDVAAMAMWGTEDILIFNGILGFWFVGRVFDRKS